MNRPSEKLPFPTCLFVWGALLVHLPPEFADSPPGIRRPPGVPYFQNAVVTIGHLYDLAACYDYVPQKAAISRYLRILGQWKLTADQWEELADRAVMRLTRRFPMPGELHEIVSELNQEAELRADSEHLDRMRAEWERHGDAGLRQN
jgi:hypothetical protein